MTEEKQRRSSVPLMMGLAVLSVVVALVFVFGRGGDDPADSPPLSPAETKSMEPASSGAARDSLAASVPREDGSPTAAAELPALAPPGPPRRAPPMERMPDHVAEAFRRGTAPISDEKRLEMEAGMHEMPPEIRAEMENAPYRTIPPDVLAAFQNPYVEISEEELEMLRQNGLNPYVEVSEEELEMLRQNGLNPGMQ